MSRFHTAPIWRREGVVAGFVLRQQYTTLVDVLTKTDFDENGEPVVTEVEVDTVVVTPVPLVTRGALFAQGIMWRPVSAPVPPAAPLSAKSYLHYNSSTGLYWNGGVAPVTAGDALIGWVRCDGTGVTVTSSRVLGDGAESTVPVPTGPVQGAGTEAFDIDVPATPFFGLGAGQRGGTVELSGISFTDLTNTTTIYAGQLNLYYWDELTGVPTLALTAGVNAVVAQLDLTAVGGSSVGDYVQLETEVVRVTAVQLGGLRYQVTRGVHGSTAAVHAGATKVYRLMARAVTIAFPSPFWRAGGGAGTFVQVVELPNVRIASAELTVTNRRGSSAVQAECFTGVVDSGLRTLMGGQYTLEVQGFLAVDANAAVPVVVERGRTVRDVFAVLGAVADANVVAVLKVNGATYATLTVPAGLLVSPAVDGMGKALAGGDKLTLAVTAVGTVFPGVDLSVRVRL